MNADPPATSTTNKRLFFALWPDITTRVALAETVRNVVDDARPTPSDNLHMTLLFLGAVAPAIEAQLCAAAEAVSIPSFDLHLDHIGAWRRGAVRWLAPSEPPDALSRLLKALQRVCDEVAVNYDRRPHRPHVTLARNAKTKSGADGVNPIRRPLAESIATPIVWHVNDFALVWSRISAGGAEYKIQRQWLLQRQSRPK